MNGNNALNDLVSRISESYETALRREMARPDYLPDKREVAEIIALLRNILFPGYGSEYDTGSEHTRLRMHDVLTDIESRLTRQICRALNLNVRKDENCAEMFGQAKDICHAFLNRMPALIELLATDVRAAYDGDPAAHSEHEIIFAYPGIFAISVYRLAHELHLLSVPLIPRIMTEYAHGLTGIDIHPAADISHHFFIDHGTGIVIGETTKIGAYVKMYQGVTLGALSTRGGQNLRGKKRHPTLEDEVTVYSGASILGGDTVIGRGSIIGGNVFLTKSVPPYTRVSLRHPELDCNPLGGTNKNEKL